MIDKDFTLYPEAFELKELGFDEPCLAWYGGSEDIFEISGNYKNSTHFVDYCVSAPTFSQAFRWFREKYNLRGFIGFRPNVKMFDYHIYDMSLSGLEYTKQRTMEEFNKDPKVGTYEEAELACLKKLIEIVKEK
jgi:hypothetical protein